MVSIKIQYIPTSYPCSGRMQVKSERESASDSPFKQRCTPELGPSREVLSPSLTAMNPFVLKTEFARFTLTILKLIALNSPSRITLSYRNTRLIFAIFDESGSETMVRSYESHQRFSPRIQGVQNDASKCQHCRLAVPDVLRSSLFTGVSGDSEWSGDRSDRQRRAQRESHRRQYCHK